MYPCFEVLGLSSFASDYFADGPLSHLLARRGLAQKIGNLIGHLHFSDDQLQRTQKGLKDAGVIMPNFGNVGRELAKEINEEPEVEVETAEERESANTQLSCV